MFCSFVNAQTTIKYIDTDNTDPNRDGSVDKPYNTMAEWNSNEAADLVASNTIHKVYCRGTTTDNSAVDLSEWIVDDDYYVEMIGENAGAIWNNSKYKMRATTNTSITVNIYKAKIRNIQFLVETTSTYRKAISAFGGNNAKLYIEGCFFKGNGNLADNTIPVLLNWDSAITGRKAYIINNAFVDLKNATNDSAIWSRSSWSNTYIYNNTFANCYNPIRADVDNACVAYNNIIYGCNNYHIGSITGGYNSLSMDSYTGLPNDRTNQTFLFVNYQLPNVNFGEIQSSGFDLHLAESDDGAKNYGRDLSYDASYAFNYDMDGKYRPDGINSLVDNPNGKLWDIGASEWTPTLLPVDCPPENEVVYNAIMKYSENLWLVVDPNFTVDWFMDSTHPYGDVNNDGVCNYVDKDIWDNVWTSIQRIHHKQRCWQMEKKAKSWVMGTVRQARTHIELMRGVRFSSSKKPIIVITD